MFYNSAEPESGSDPVAVPHVNDVFGPRSRAQGVARHDVGEGPRPGGERRLSRRTTTDKVLLPRFPDPIKANLGEARKLHKFRTTENPLLWNG